ncbi:MAG: EAL domain-containing protein [Treponema sp.]
MKKKLGIQQSRSIFVRIFIPLVIVLMVQIAFTMVVFLRMNIVKQAKENTYLMLNEKVFNRYMFLEAIMKNQWTDLKDACEVITETIEDKIKTNNIHFDDIKPSSNIEIEILKSTFPTLEQVLSKNMVTGAYFILDIPQNNRERAGIYLRRKALPSFNENRSDVLAECVPEYMFNYYNLEKSSSYTPNLKLHEDSVFYDEPIKKARFANGNQRPKTYGVWNYGKVNTDEKLITYSIPILDEVGKVYGVLGIDVSREYINKVLQFKNIDFQTNETYYVVFADKEDDETFSILTSQSKTESFNAKKLDFPNIYEITINDAEQKKYHASIHYLSLHDEKEDNEKLGWALVATTDTRNLLRFPRNLLRVIIFSLSVSSILLFLSAYMLSQHLSSILKRVLLDLRSQSNRTSIRIARVQIKEIDSLIDTIEDNSEKLFSQARRVSRIVTYANPYLGVFEDDATLSSVYCNANFFKICRITKYGEAVFVDRDEFNHFFDAFRDKVYYETDTNVIYSVPTNVPGKLQWIEIKKIKEKDYVLGMVHDITKELEEKRVLEIQLKYDTLTGLYRKTIWDQKVHSILENDFEAMYALVIWNIDNLSYINNTYGHPCGDMYIQHFSKVLSGLSPKHCISCKVSGDEFASFFFNLSSKKDIQDAIMSFWNALEKEVFILPTGERIKIRVSAGLAWYPDDTNNFRELSNYANFALYHSKHTIKGTICEFDKDIYKKNYILLQGTENLNKLLDNKAICYAMQPIIDGRSGKVYGYEMLMRSKMQEFKSPADILRLAKVQSKLYIIEEITLFESMKTYSSKIKEGLIPKDTKVFINTINSQSLSKKLFQAFENEYRDYLENIVLEITETDSLDDAFFAQKLEYIKKWNAMIAIDDFGTGYNTDVALIFLSPNLVKIDMSIVRDVDKDIDKQNILENLMSYTKKRNIIVLAEGVERIEEVETLVSFGVDLFQGYYFAKPDFEIKEIDKEKVELVKSLYKKNEEKAV